MSIKNEVLLQDQLAKVAHDLFAAEFLMGTNQPLVAYCAIEKLYIYAEGTEYAEFLQDQLHLFWERLSDADIALLKSRVGDGTRHSVNQCVILTGLT